MPKKKHTLAAVTSGRKTLPGSYDQRSLFFRRYRDLIRIFEADLGGAERLSALQQQLVRRAAAISSRCELVESDLAAGRPVDDERFASDVGLLVRISRQLGLQRVARDVSGTPDLRSYLAARAARSEPPTLDAEPVCTIEAEPGDLLTGDAENRLSDDPAGKTERTIAQRVASQIAPDHAEQPEPINAEQLAELLS